MDLKNAVAVCLISLFSATLVVLIARALDSQAASRLEPQLVRIAEELETIRKQGGISASPAAAVPNEAVDSGLIVYYFHGNTRCPTCQAIESQAKQTVEKDFAAQLASGEVVWKVLNYEQPAAKSLATKFEIQMSVVVLAKMKSGQLGDWKRLDEVWALVGDKPAFAKHVAGEINRMLAGGQRPTPAAPSAGASSIPIPAAEVPGPAVSKEPPAIPIPDAKTSDPQGPKGSSDLPLPK